MKVLLMDLDVIKQRRPYPNLALMKLSAHHKARGDEVYLNFPLQPPDISFASCIFSWNAKGRASVPDGATLGGSGIDLKAQLPPEVEHMMPDYSLYPNVDFSLGFTSRGCIRKCPWCVVPEKEGNIKPWARIYEFWDRRHQKIVLLDNNLLAASNWRQTMDDLIYEELEVDFNQGLDIRLVNEDNVGYLRRVKARSLRFAFDHIGYSEAVKRGIELLTGNGVNSRKLSFYVLTGFIDDKSAIERLKILYSYNVDVFPMIYKGPNGKMPEESRASLREIREGLGVDKTMWHGSRHNINKFLRVIGRLPD